MVFLELLTYPFATNGLTSVFLLWKIFFETNGVTAGFLRESCSHEKRTFYKHMVSLPFCFGRAISWRNVSFSNKLSNPRMFVGELWEGETYLFYAFFY